MLRSPLIVAALALVALGPVAGTAARADETRIPVVTRLVQQFGEREGALADAAARHDADTLDKLLADDFELRSGARPGVPVPRADWIADALGAPVKGVRSEMAAIDHGTIVAVSFLWRRAGAKPTDPGTMFVDLWQKDGDAWRLATRYAAVARGGMPQGTGAASAPVIRKKY